MRGHHFATRKFFFSLHIISSKAICDELLTNFKYDRLGLRKQIRRRWQNWYINCVPKSLPVLFFPQGATEVENRKLRLGWQVLSWLWLDFFLRLFLQAAHGFWGQARQKVITLGGCTPPTASQDSEEEFIHLRLAAAPREQRRFRKQGEIFTDTNKADQLLWTFGRQKPLEERFQILFKQLCGC